MAGQAAAAGMEATAAMARARDASAEAAALAAANQELMARKVSMEWQLIQALSSSKVRLDTLHDDDSLRF